MSGTGGSNTTTRGPHDPEFPPDYVTARRRFGEAAARLGLTLDAYPIPETGPAGETLTIDVATHGPADARSALVVSSGLHGVEGPFGSAVQTTAMNGWIDGGGPPSGLRIVFIHALNPFGFAWGRRCDAENVDPNRNFLLDGEAYRGSPPAYAALDPLLNPTRAPRGIDLFALRMIAALVRHGRSALKQAIVTGQYDYPRGLFFGGHGPSTLTGIVRAHLRSWVGRPTLAAHLDLHTGLGRFGRYRLLVDERQSRADLDLLSAWFGADAIERTVVEATSYRARGELGRWCAAHLPDVRYYYACAEFGTYGNLRMLATLRAENRAWHLGGREEPDVARARARLRDCFCPPAAAWRSRVLAGGVRLVEQAIRGLTSSAGGHAAGAGQVS